MKNSSQVPSGWIVHVLQNCCTRPSFVFALRNSDQLPSGSILSIHSLSKLGVAIDILRNDRLFCHTLYNLATVAMIQQRRSTSP